MSETTEPTIDVTHRSCLILDLPGLSDESAWKFFKFLQFFPKHIDTHYLAQISRTYRAHESDREQLHRERDLAEAQHSLPFADPPF